MPLSKMADAYLQKCRFAELQKYRIAPMQLR